MRGTHPRFLTGRCTTVRLVSSLCTHQAEREGTHQKLPRAPRQSSLPPRLQAPSLRCSHRLRWGERAGAGLQPTAATRRRSHANLVLKETSGHRGFADAWARLFVPLASFPLPPAGDGRERADRLRAEMAAVVRGARAGRGGHGRDQGRRRGRAEEQEAVPQVQDRVTPLHHQWSLWCDGNRNTIKLVDSDELKAYRVLEQSANIDRLELDSFAIPDGLLVQPAHIVRMLYDLVDYYNNMMMIRRKYLVKKLDGCWSKEMKQMLKTHDKYLDRVNEKLDAIADAGGNCPPRPKVFDAHPKLCK